MKTIGDLKAWLEGAAAKFGDPAIPVCQLFIRYVPASESISSLRPEMLCLRDGDEFFLRLGKGLFFPVAIAAAPRIERGVLRCFGADEIATGVWALNPSLNLPRVLHGFVILYDVPSPAPWQTARRKRHS